MGKHTEEYREFGKGLRDLREAAGLTQAEAASEADVSHETWNRWENGHNVPRDENIVKIARVLKIDPADLVDRLTRRATKMDLEKRAERARFQMETEPPSPPRSVRGMRFSVEGHTVRIDPDGSFVVDERLKLTFLTEAGEGAK